MAAAGEIQQQEGTTPSAPPSGYWSIYPKSDGYYIQDDTATESKLADAAGLIEDAINNGVTDKAPSENAVFDAITTINASIATKQPLDATLTSLAAYNTNGLLTQTAPDTFAGRTLTAGAGISIGNGDGVAGNPTIASTITQYTDEMAQDAVGGAFLATASIIPDYDDTTNEMLWDVNPAGVDHELLGNYQPDKHVDHTAVSMIAGYGLSGGGDISANRTFDLDFSTLLPEAERIAPDDSFAIHDASQAATKAISLRDFLAQRMSLIDVTHCVSDDFIRDATGGLTGVGAGTGNSTQNGAYGFNTVENALGVSQCDTGTTATGRRLLGTASLIQLSTGIARLRFGARIAPELLSTALETFTVYVGFIDNSGAGDHTDACYFRYTDAVNGGRWEAVTSRNSVRTATDTGVAPTTNYQILEVDIAENSSEVKFYIDGTLVATNTTNIPTIGGSDAFGYGWKIEKSVGTTQRNLSADWYYFELERSNPR